MPTEPSRLHPETVRRRTDRVRNLRGRVNWFVRTALQEVRSDRTVVLGPRSTIAVRAPGRATFGARVVIREETTVSVYGQLRVGSDVFIGRGSLISCFDHISIGEGVRLGERVSIHDENHVYEPLSDSDGRKHDYLVAPIEIGDRVWIAANAVVLAGTTIGADSVIAAGSVVRGDFPSGVLIAGCPAQVKRPLR